MRATALALLLSLLPASGSFSSVDYEAQCAATRYFDISSLLCTDCPDTQAPDQAGTACACDGTVLTEGDDGTYSCVACTGERARASDGLTCMPCSASSTDGYQPDTGRCLCPAGHAIAERDGLGVLLPAMECSECPSDAYVGADQFCVSCPAEYMVALPNDEQGCQCDDGFVLEEHDHGLWGRDVSCVQRAAYDVLVSQLPSATAPEASEVVYYDVIDSDSSTTTVSSKLFSQLMMPAATECLRAVEVRPSVFTNTHPSLPTPTTGH